MSLPPSLPDAATVAEIRAAVAANSEEQTAFLAEIVAFPSTRGQESPMQDFMADALRERGYAVDAWTIDPRALESLPGYGPAPADFTRARTVVGSHRPAETVGRSLIMQGHVDVVPAGPLEMWASPPFTAAVRDGWMYGRGAGDMKAGLAAAIFALDALRAAGFAPGATVHLQSVIEEESTGLGALSTLERGYRADCVLIPEPTAHELVRAQVGVLWFKLRVRGRPTHVAYAGEGSNAILAAFHVIEALRVLEAEWNEAAAQHPLFARVAHPLNFNPGMIAGGDWASSVPAWCDVDCRIGLLPGTSIADAQAAVQACVAQAACGHPFLRDNPPEVIWNGFLAEGWVLEDAAFAYYRIMDQDAAAFAALGHPSRLAIFRLLARRAPGDAPAGEIADALGIARNVMSAHLAVLSRAGLIHGARHGKQIRYRIDLARTGALIDYLALDCCRGRPEICAPLSATVFTRPRPQEDSMAEQRPFNVLFICTGNSARSIFAEAIMNAEGAGRFRAFSAGTKPYSELNPYAVGQLEKLGHDVSALRSKNVAEFQGAGCAAARFRLHRLRPGGQ
jgi:acetylornithine deacetylase